MIRTDYGETVHLAEDPYGDIRLWLTRDLPDMADERTDEVVLRPSQAERLAAELLAYANGDHKLPPDAVRPVRIVEAAPLPAHDPSPDCRCDLCNPCPSQLGDVPVKRRTAVCGCVWEHDAAKTRGWRWKNIAPCIDHRRGDAVESVADGSRESVGSALGSAPDGGYVCDECGEPGDGHKADCAWAKRVTL